MSSLFSGPVTHWIVGFRAGEVRSATELFNECWRILAPVVRRMLQGWHSYYEEDDILQSSFGDFSHHARRGGCPGVVNRESLWAYLLVCVSHKLAQYQRRELAQRRGGGLKRQHVDLDRLSTEASRGQDETSSFETLVLRAMSFLPSDSFREIARLRLLEQRDAETIALELGCSPQTVYRKLKIIKELWAQQADQSMATTKTPR